MTYNNAVIGFDRWTAQFAFAAGDGSTWDESFPVANLGAEPLYRAARAVGTTASFAATSPTPWPVGLMAFVGHSAGLDDTFRIQGFYDEGLSDPAFDTGVQEFWPIVFDQTALPAESENFWTGKYTPRQIAAIRTRTRPVLLEQPHQVRGLLVSVASADFRCRLFEIAHGYELGCNFAFGSAFGLVSRTTAVQADGGHKEFDVRPAPRAHRGTIPLMQRSEALSRWGEMLAAHDTHTPFLWFPHPGEEVHWLRTVYLVRNTEVGLMEYVSHDRTKIPFSFEEVQ